MTFPITIESQNGHFTAALLGAPQVKGAGATRDQAIEHLKATLAQLVENGDLIALDVTSGGVSSLAGRYADDPTLREICEEAYRSRDAEPRE